MSLLSACPVHGGHSAVTRREEGSRERPLLGAPPQPKQLLMSSRKLNELRHDNNKNYGIFPTSLTPPRPPLVRELIVNFLSMFFTL